MLSEPELSGDPIVVVLSGTSDGVELAGRAIIAWKKVVMPRREARRRVLEGILAAWI